MQYLLSRIDWLFGIQRCLPPQGEVSVVRELDIYPWRTEKDLSIIMLMFERMIKIILDKIHYEFRVLFSEIEEFMVDNKIDKNIEEVKMLLIKFNCFLVLEHPKYDEIKETQLKTIYVKSRKLSVVKTRLKWNMYSVRTRIQVKTNKVTGLCSFNLNIF